MERICEGCKSKFEAVRGTARFCSEKCKKQVQRSLAGQTEKVSGTKPLSVPVSGTDPLKRITRPPEKVYEGYYQSTQYKNLIEELKLKPLKQIREEGYWIPNWKENGVPCPLK